MASGRPSPICRPECLRRILKNGNLVSIACFQYRIHVCWLSVEMHCDDRFRQFVVPGPFRQRSAEERRIQIPGLPIAIDKYRSFAPM